MLKSKKILSILLVVIFIIASATNVFATDLKTKLYVTQASSEIKQLENEQGEISKTIVNSNPDSGEVTIELKLFNSKKEQASTDSEKFENTEIYIMISENITTDSEKLTKYINSIEKLAKKILGKNSKTKIGIIGIKGTINDSIKGEDGKMTWGENDEGDVAGRINDSEIVVNLTNNVETIKNGIKNMNSSKTKYNINLQAAISLAKKSYTSNINKILISLYDDVPDVAVGVKTMVSYGGWSSPYSTMEEAVVAKHQNIVSKTKNEMLGLKDSNIQFILLRPEDTSFDQEWYNIQSGEKELDFDGSPYVNQLYGSMSNPTYGKMYSLKEENFEKIVTENIYEDIMEQIQTGIDNVVIQDYFPTDITENFEFSYEGNPSIGTVSDSIDPDTKTITWNIGTLNNQETATLRYKLKIKDMKNENLLNKTIATNEKVVLTYIDYTDKDYEVVLNSSPKITLKEQANLESIQITKAPNKIEYTVGEKFSNAGMEVIANYSDGSKIDVTDKCTYSPAEALKKTDTQITVKYAEDSITKEAKQTISVKDKVIENNNNNNNINNTKKDNTIATGNIPYTGGTTVIIASVLAIIAVGAYLYKRNKDFKGI